MFYSKSKWLIIQHNCLIGVNKKLFGVFFYVKKIDWKGVMGVDF